jgi:hypothetical protein
MNKPLILEEGKNTMDDVRYVRNTLPIWQESDIYIAQLKEVFEITHPELIFLPEKFQEEWEKFLVQKLERPVDYFSGNWIYFPWSGRFVHMGK